MKANPEPTGLPTKAEDMFCFAVYAASHVINRAYTPLLRPLGLTYPQYIALTFLWAEDPLGVGDLARRLKMESSTVTPLLKRLQQLGHIERRRGKRDERQVFVHLTESGRALQKKAPEITACMVGETGLTHQALDDLVTTLGQLTDNLARDAQSG